MADELKRGAIGKEDFTFHNPATGTAVQTFNRLTSTGGTTPITAISAENIPLRDVPHVTGAFSPFETLADTQAAKQIEAALAVLRKEQVQMHNFEHKGGQAGSGVSAAVASKNTDVLNQIFADIGTSGRTNGVFFPGATYEFLESGGNMPVATGRSGIVLMGTGLGALLKQHSTSAPGNYILEFVDCSNIVLADLAFQKNGTVANANVRFRSTGAAYNNIIVDHIQTTSGGNGLTVEGPAAGMSGLWINRSTFQSTSAHGLLLINVQNAQIQANTVLATLGILASCSGGAAPLQDLNFTANILGGVTSQDLIVARTGTYTGNIHRGVTCIGNRISDGQISISGMNEVEASSNIIYSGQMIVNMTDMTTATGLKAIANRVIGSSGYAVGLAVQGSNTTLDGFLLGWNVFMNQTQQAMVVDFATSPASLGLIVANNVRNASRRDSDATDFSGIQAKGTGGVRETQVVHNTIRCNALTGVNSNRHLYGYEELGGSTANIVAWNYIKGYLTAATLLAGTSTSTWAGQNMQATPWDGGAAV